MKHKVAFVGFRHGHVESLYKRMAEDPQIEIVALCEENADAAAAVEKSGRHITHTDYAEMLEEVDFDILCIGDYYGIRGERAIAGLKAGKHVISDKPLCTSLDELQKIRSLDAIYRDVLLLKHLYEYDNSLIASLTGVAEATVRVRLMRAKRLLEQILKGGGTDE